MNKLLTAEDLDYPWPAPDLTEDEWRQIVAHGLRKELEDPQDDIYSEEDGAPVDLGY